MDPLFKKTSAEFDEGGAKSLLLNSLHVHGYGEVIFDTTDATQCLSDANNEEIAEEGLRRRIIDGSHLESEYFREYTESLLQWPHQSHLLTTF